MRRRSGYGGNHADALVGISPAQAVALQIDGRPLAPMALVTVDGGNGYWNPHPDDDPMAMVIGELIPLCRRLGLGRPPRRIAMMGISMGGYGALLLAEKYPRLIAATAAISPAIWTSYAQARGANAGAYASAAAFAANDAVTHALALAHVPVRVASGYDDPFYPGVQALARALPAGAVVDLAKGCHTGAFFAEQQPPSLAFLARQLASLGSGQLSSRSAALAGGGGGAKGRLTQLGAGGEVSFPSENDVVVVPCVLVPTATTRMSPAGIPCAFTVKEPSFELVPCTVMLPRANGTAGAGSDLMLGQPASTGTMTTLSPSWCSFAFAWVIPDFW